MKDRTLIMLGLLFLVLTIGAGVNRSLESCSGMVGQSLGDGPKELTQAFAERGMDTAKTAVKFSREQVSGLAEKGIEKVGLLAEQGKVRAGVFTERLREQVNELLNTAKQKTVAQKN